MPDPDDQYKIAEVPSPTSSYADTTVVGGTLYYYSLFPIDAEGIYFDSIYQTQTAVESSGGGSGGGGGGRTTTPPSPAPAPIPAPGSVPYAVGTLVKSGSAVYLVTEPYVAVGFTSAEAFLGLGYSWSNVISGNLSGYRISDRYFLSSPTQAHPWSSWVKYGRTVYYINNAGLVPVPSYDVFVNNGGQNKFVLPVNPSDSNVWRANPNLPVLTNNDPRVKK